jgi:hypothetical protein
VLDGNQTLCKASLICSVPSLDLLLGTLEPGGEFMKAIVLQPAEGKPAHINPDSISARAQPTGGRRDYQNPPDVVAATAHSNDTEAVAGYAVISSAKWQSVADQQLLRLI